MPRCCIPSCFASFRSKPKNVRFNKIPRDSSIRSRWLEALKDDRIANITELGVVCSKHFRNEDYELRGVVMKLKNNDVPSVDIGKTCARQLKFHDVVQPSTSAGTSASSPTLVPLDSTSETDESATEHGMKRKRDTTGTSDISTDSSMKITLKPSITKQEICKTFHNYSSVAEARGSDSVSTDSSGSARRKSVTPLVSPTKSISSSLERKRKVTKLFHSYSHSPNYVQKQLRIQKDKNVIMKSKLKCTQKMNTSLRKKVNSLNDIVKDLRQKKALSDSGFDVLDHTFSSIPLSIMKRLVLTSKEVLR